MRAILLLLVPLAAIGPCPSQDPSRQQSRFFASDVVQDIHLEVEAADLKRLSDALPERIYVPATVRWQDTVLKRVGLRYKGNSSSRPDQTHKRSFLLKFSEFVAGQRFLGLRRVALDNGVQFGSLFSERMITDILRDVGVRASRSNYARVNLNGEFLGVYVNVERIDKTFVAQHFSGKGHAIYKVHNGGPGADLRYAGEDPLRYAKTFDLKSGNQTADMADLVRFIKGVDGRDPGFEFQREFDVDGFLWQVGVLLLAGAFDQYTGWNPHNYYLIRDSANPGRWHYLTWDVDVGFADRAFGRVPVLDGWNAAWPVPREGRPLLERVVRDPKLLALYRERTKKLLETHFEPKRLGARLDRLHAQIKEDLKRDPFPKRRITNPTDGSYEDVIASMKKFMVARHETALAQLSNPGSRPRPLEMAQRERPRAGRGGPRDAGPQPGVASKDAPTELTVVRNSKDGVQLSWKDNALGERAFIVQRSTGAASAPFQNCMGLPGENLSGATDTGARAGVTYRYRVFAVKPTQRGMSGTGVSNVVTVTAAR